MKNAKGNVILFWKSDRQRVRCMYIRATKASTLGISDASSFYLLFVVGREEASDNILD